MSDRQWCCYLLSESVILRDWKQHGIAHNSPPSPKKILQVARQGTYPYWASVFPLFLQIHNLQWSTPQLHLSTWNLARQNKMAVCCSALNITLIALTFCLHCVNNWVPSVLWRCWLGGRTFVLWLFHIFCSDAPIILPSVLWRCWLGGRKGM